MKPFFAVLILALSSPSFALELSFEDNPPESEYKYIVKIDGSSEFKASHANKLLACYNNPPSEPSNFRESLEKLIEFPMNEFRANVDQLNSSPGQFGLLETNFLELKSFVEGPLESCMTSASDAPPAPRAVRHPKTH